MNWLHRADDFLIDRVFQPIADLLAPVITCVMLGHLFTGLLVVFGLGWCVTRPAYWVAPLFLIYGSARLFRLTPTRLGMMPIERVRGFLGRLMDWLIIILIVPSEILDPTIDTTFILAELVCWLISDYFYACRRNPPKPRKFRMPAWLASQGAA